MNQHVSRLKFNHFALFFLYCCLFSFPEFVIPQENSRSNANNFVIAGHQADRWYFGQNAGLDFRPDVPAVDLSNIILNVLTSPAIMADSSGEILFFTNGYRIYNRLGDTMPDGNGLHGFSGNPMPVLIVPKPGNEHIYYVFTTHRPRMNPNDVQTLYGLEYSEVNMNLNEGLGGLTFKNKVLLGPEISSKLSAVKHINGTDYWVVAHKFNSDEFCSFRVTSEGVDSTSYVSSHIGTFHAGPGEDNNAIGYMKLSPDGTKLALAIFGSHLLEVFDFDQSTGKVMNSITSPAVFEDAYGIEFSPDSKYLYVTTTSTLLPVPNYTPISYLYQFELGQGNQIFNPGFNHTIAMDTTGSYFAGMQLGTDGRIYISRSPYGNGSLSVIQNPKRHGEDCNFTSNSIDLQGRQCRYGLPNFIQSYFNLPHFNAIFSEVSASTTFRLQNMHHIDSLIWNFDDPSSDQNSSVDFVPEHVFSAPGVYEVSVTEYFEGIPFGPYAETVTINYSDINEKTPDENPVFQLYPNPGDGRINLVFKQDLKDAVIYIKNMVGQQVKEPVKINNPNENEILGFDIDKLTPGIYFIEVTIENQESYSVKYLLYQ